MGRKNGNNNQYRTTINRMRFGITGASETRADLGIPTKVIDRQRVSGYKEGETMNAEMMVNADNQWYVHNNYTSVNNTGDRNRVNDRVLEVIDRRNQQDAPVHEPIALGRKSSRRNMNERNEIPREDFSPVRGSSREDNHRNTTLWGGP